MGTNERMASVLCKYQGHDLLLSLADSSAFGKISVLSHASERDSTRGDDELRFCFVEEYLSPGFGSQPDAANRRQ